MQFKRKASSYLKVDNFCKGYIFNEKFADQGLTKYVSFSNLLLIFLLCTVLDFLTVLTFSVLLLIEQFIKHSWKIF